MDITTIIVVATAIVSFIAFRDHALRDKLIFNPYLIEHRKQWYRFFSSGFIHADLIHLIINMFVLYSFGKYVEDFYADYFESRAVFNFLLLYFGGMALSVLPTFTKHKNDPGYNALGASGAVSAVVFAFIVFRPLAPFYIYGLIRLPGIVFGALYLLYSYYSSKRKGDYINHDAHFWGAVCGFLFTILLKPQLFVAFLNQMPFLHDAF
jgi:membrane associated rhomboid family serine protease